MTKSTSMSIDDSVYSLCSKLNLSFHSYLLPLNNYFNQPKLMIDNISFKRFWVFYVKHDDFLAFLLAISGTIIGFVAGVIKSPILFCCSIFLLLSVLFLACIDSRYIKDLNNQILIEPQYSQAYHFLSSIFKAIQEIEGIPNAENAMIWLFNHPDHSISLKILWDKNIRSSDELKRLVLLNFKDALIKNQININNVSQQNKLKRMEIQRFHQNIQFLVQLSDLDEHEMTKDLENEYIQKLETMKNAELTHINNELEQLIVQSCSGKSFTTQQLYESVNKMFLN